MTREAVEDLTNPKAGATPVAPTLAAWAGAVGEQRRAGALGMYVATATAADLVLRDRSTRQPG